MLVELLGLFVVDGFELFEEVLLFGWFFDAAVVVDEMFLLVFFQSIEDLVLHFRYILPYFRWRSHCRRTIVGRLAAPGHCSHYN